MNRPPGQKEGGIMMIIKCECGHEFRVESSHGQYDIMSLECLKCGRTVAEGNTQTGKVYSWVTREAVQNEQ